MAKGVLIAAMDFSAAPEDEFHDWYDLEHIPERLRVPGFLNADRWIGTENPKISVATYDLDNVGALHSPPYLAVGGENGSPWTKRTAKFRKSILRYEGEQVIPGDRTAPPGAAALFMIGMNVAPEHEHEFNEWYNSEHIPALGAVPGVLCARRYRGTGGTQRYVALYHLTAPEVVRSAEWKKAADTPWTQKMRPHSATCCALSAADILARNRRLKLYLSPQHAWLWGENLFVRTTRLKVVDIHRKSSCADLVRASTSLSRAPEGGAGEGLVRVGRSERCRA